MMAKVMNRVVPGVHHPTRPKTSRLSLMLGGSYSAIFPESETSHVGLMVIGCFLEARSWSADFLQRPLTGPINSKMVVAGIGTFTRCPAQWQLAGRCNLLQLVLAFSGLFRVFAEKMFLSSPLTIETFWSRIHRHALALPDCADVSPIN